MAKIYAVREDNGERFLYRTTCDWFWGCDAYITLGETEEGWTKCVVLDADYANEWHYCPIHS